MAKKNVLILKGIDKSFVGKYEKLDGIKFDVIETNGKLEMAKEGKAFQNRPFFPITEYELRIQLDKKIIRKL